MSVPEEAIHALGRVPSGLFVLTAGQGADETGLLASWVQQCSFDPPRLTIAVKSDRPISALLTDGAPLALHLIGEGQNSLISHFGKGFAPGQPAFTGLEVTRHPGQAPVLPQAFAHLLCRVAGRFTAGDHDLILAEVVGGKLSQPEGKPMIHIRKSGLRY